MRIASGDLYVSCVEGYVVGRFGSGTALVKGQNIGVYPKLEVQKHGGHEFAGLRWDTDEVVFIPRAEYLAHLKAYDQELAAGSLKIRSKDDFDAWRKKQAEESAKDAPKPPEPSPEPPPEPAPEKSDAKKKAAPAAKES